MSSSDTNGGNILIAYGKMLAQLENRIFDRQQNEKEQSLKAIKEMQEKVAWHFEVENKRASLKQYICKKPETTSVDPVPTAIISYLLHKLFNDAEELVFLATLSNIVGKACNENPLEIRKIVFKLLVNGDILRVVDDRDGSNSHIGLSGTILKVLLGDASHITPAKVQEYVYKKQEKASKKTKASTQSTPCPISSSMSLKEFISHLPLLTPQELFNALGQKGYVGQTKARKAVCLAVYRFISRLKKIHLKGMNPKDVPYVGHFLLKGETGTGKSYLLKCLSEITGLPTLIEDITRYSETGYFGEDVQNILTRALNISNNNLEIAQACSVITIDEIDKISSSKIGHALVSRDGVQRSLLKLIEGTITDVPLDPSDHPYRGKRVRFDTSKLLWVGIGAFSGWESIVGKKASLGFSAKDGHEQREQVGGSDGFSAYGFGEEIFGRFTGGVIELDPLSKEEMRQILLKNTLPKYRTECEQNGIKLEIEDNVYDQMIDDSMKMKTGARGLQSTLEGKLSDALFDAYSVSDLKVVRLAVEKGQIITNTRKAV